jgi:hypothetical protein
MVNRKVVPFDEFYYQLKLMHLFQKHPVYYTVLFYIVLHFTPTPDGPRTLDLQIK